MDYESARHAGENIARECIEEAPSGPGAMRLREVYLQYVRRRCGAERDSSLGLVVDELERRGNTGELDSAGGLLAFVSELEQDVPEGSCAHALLRGVAAGAIRYGEGGPI